MYFQKTAGFQKYFSLLCFCYYIKPFFAFFRFFFLGKNAKLNSWIAFSTERSLSGNFPLLLKRTQGGEAR